MARAGGEAIKGDRNEEVTEMTEALRVLTARMSNVRCAGPATWKPMTGISGPSTLPLTFGDR